MIYINNRSVLQGICTLFGLSWVSLSFCVMRSIFFTHVFIFLRLLFKTLTVAYSLFSISNIHLNNSRTQIKNFSSETLMWHTFSRFTVMLPWPHKYLRNVQSVVRQRKYCKGRIFTYLISVDKILVLPKSCTVYNGITL